MSGGFYIGTSVEQDTRFGDASKKLLKQMDFSSILKKPVDMTKVSIDAIKPWISERVKELLGLDDEVLYEYIVNMLEESSTPDPKLMQVNLTGFLESKTSEFMQSLWKVLLEAQKSPGGVPESFIQKKIDELKQKRNQEEIIKANIAIANNRFNSPSTTTGDVVRKPTRPSGRKSRWDTTSSSKDVASTDDHHRDSDGYMRTTRGTEDERHDSRWKSKQRHVSSRSRSPSSRRMRSDRRDDRKRVR